MQKIKLEAGDYLIDNSRGPIKIGEMKPADLKKLEKAPCCEHRKGSG